MGWDAPQRVVYNANVLFTGKWSISDVPPDDSGEWDDDYLVNYNYILKDAEEGEELPEAIWETIPNDENDEYGPGDTVEALEPSERQITVDDVTYIFDGWDMDSDTFSEDHKTITFTGSWVKSETP